MTLLALRTGQLLNQSEVAHDAGLSQPTVHRYLNLLESHPSLRPHPALYRESQVPRLLKSPRAFWADVGLAVFLAGYFARLTSLIPHEQGRILGKTLIYQHLRVELQPLDPACTASLLAHTDRRRSGFVIEHGRRVVGVEVKMTDAPGYRHITGLKKFLDEHPQAVAGVLLHSGRQVARLNNTYMPWSMLTG